MKTKAHVIEDKCNGCGRCVAVCNNNVLQVLNQRAKVINEKSCDGIARCMEFCEQGAIEMIETSAYVCEGEWCEDINESELYNWPVQLSGVNVSNRYLPDSNLVLAADCAAYAYATFHRDFIRDHVVLIACVKNDLNGHFEAKLTQLFAQIHFQSIQVVLMNAECCQPLLQIVKKAASTCGKEITYRECVITPSGERYE